MSNETKTEQEKSEQKVSPKPASKKSKRLQALARRNFVADMPDRGLFAVIAIGGFGAIMALRIWQYPPIPVAIFAIGLMQAYGVIAYRVPAIRMRPDRLGDNFYYLGFIYTLASLSAALFQIRGLTNDLVLTEMLGNFGLALITTIVGIAGRVVFVQMRMEIDDAEEEVRNDVLKASQQLKGQLNAAITEFEIFRTSVQQILIEHTKPGLEASSTLAQSQIERIADVAKSASNRIEATFETHEAQARRLREMVDKTVAPTEEAIKKLGETKVPVDDFRKTLKQFTNELDEYTASIGRVVEEINRNQRPIRWWHFRRRRALKQYG